MIRCSRCRRVVEDDAGHTVASYTRGPRMPVICLGCVEPRTPTEDERWSEEMERRADEARLEKRGWWR